MKKCTLIVSIFMVVFMAATNVFAVSEAALLFLLISPHSRAAGMGEAFVGLADDVSAVYWNPAGLAYQQGKQFTTMYVRWLPQFNLEDLYYLFGAYRQDIEGLGTVGGSVTFLNLGDQTRTDETGNELDNFSSNEFAVTLSYATLLSENLGFGLNLRFVRSNLAPFSAGSQLEDGRANAFAVDIGVLKRKFFLENLSFGLNISNIGPKITYADRDQADPIPTNLRAGFAYRVLNQEYNKVTLVFDVNKLLVNRDENGVDPVFKAFFTSWGNNDLILNFGGEYWYADLIALRAGYNYDNTGNLKYLTIGAGIRYAIYQFDFGYVTGGQGNPLSDTMRFTLTIGK